MASQQKLIIHGKDFHILSKFETTQSKKIKITVVDQLFTLTKEEIVFLSPPIDKKILNSKNK
jgi:hypothetical protein